MTRKLNKKESPKVRTSQSFKETSQKDNNIRPVSQEEFDKVIKALLNSPPRKKRREGK